MAAAALSFPVEAVDDVMTVVPRSAVQFPLPIPIPAGFDVDDLRTWPRVEGRLEFVKGRLEFMPPCASVQLVVAVDVTTELNLWCRSTTGFVAGGNEAGMKLQGDVRGADGVIFRKEDMPAQNIVPRRPPVLAVEVMGRDDTLAIVQGKAVWYLAHGVETVWIIDPDKREAHVATAAGTIVVAGDAAMPEPASLPGLTPRLASFFRQL